MKLKVINSYSCEPVMSTRDVRYELELDEYKVIVVMCQDKDSDKLHDLLIEKVVDGKNIVYGREAQELIEKTYSIENIISQLNQ